MLKYRVYKKKFYVEMKQQNDLYEYAYYLVKNKEVLEKKWYTSNKTVEFDLVENGVYNVIVFRKNKDTQEIKTFDTDIINYFKGIKSSKYIKIDEMEVTNICNLQCENCPTPSTKYPKGFMDDRTVLQTLAWTIKGQTLNYHRQGEPLLHKSLEKYIRWGCDVGVKPNISTNALLLTVEKLENMYNAGLRQLVITLHTKTSFDNFKNAYDWLIKNKINVVRYEDRLKKEEKESFYFQAKFLDFGENDDNTNYIRSQIDTLGKEYLPYVKVTKTHTWAGNATNAEKIEDLDNIYNKQSKCYFINQSVVNVRWNGTIVGCCFDSENDNEVGHIRDFNNVDIDLNKYNLCKNCDDNWAT